MSAPKYVDPCSLSFSVLPCCAPTLSLVATLRTARQCPICQRHHEPDLEATVARVAGPVAARPGRDLRADDPRPAPTRRHDTRPTEPETTARLRRLLCALRPDRRGPFGWPFDGACPSDERPSATRERVQASAEVPSILPGAFAERAEETEGTRVARALDATARRFTDALARLEGDELVAARVALRGAVALSWLQRHGTLRAGADALYRSLADALATDAQRARWKVAPRGAVAWGAARVTEAENVWEMVPRER